MWKEKFPKLLVKYLNIVVNVVPLLKCLWNQCFAYDILVSFKNLKWAESNGYFSFFCKCYKFENIFL